MIGQEWHVELVVGSERRLESLFFATETVEIVLVRTACFFEHLPESTTSPMAPLKKAENIARLNQTLRRGGGSVVIIDSGVIVLGIERAKTSARPLLGILVAEWFVQVGKLLAKPPGPTVGCLATRSRESTKIAAQLPPALAAAHPLSNHAAPYIPKPSAVATLYPISRSIGSRFSLAN